MRRIVYKKGLSLSYLVIFTFTASFCQSVQTIFLQEEIRLPKNYIYQENISHLNNKIEKRPIAIYLFNLDHEIKTINDLGKLKDLPQKNYKYLNNRGIACLISKDFPCAEKELLHASLSGDPHVIHNLRVLYKWQQKELLVYK